MTIENVHIFSAKVKDLVDLYAKALTETQGRKVCTEMGISQGIPHDRIYKALSLYHLTIPYIKAELYEELKKLIEKFPEGKFVIDDGSIMKPYAKDIEGLSAIRDGATGRVFSGLATVVLAWTNGCTMIPLYHEFWFPKELIDEGYRSKQEIAQQLIMRFKDIIAECGITMDALYATPKILKFLCDNQIAFELKIHSNRSVKSGGIKKALKSHPELKLIRNSRCKTISITWHEMALFATVEKFKNRDCSTAYRYTVSNQNITAKEHIAFYRLRWVIEVFFRTAKQKLGFSNCQSRAIEKQNSHVFSIFYTYTKLQAHVIEFKLKSVDVLLRCVRIAKSKGHESPIVSSVQAFECYA
jgi:hypothetical protein